MTTKLATPAIQMIPVVEAYRLGRYDNTRSCDALSVLIYVVEAYRLGRYDNCLCHHLIG